MALQTATNPQTGERVALVGDSWQPILQSATNKEGAKAYLVGDSWLTDTPVAAEPEARANVGAEIPKWGKENPRLYEGLVKARQMLGPTAEAGGAIAGGLVGTAGGPLGTVAGAGLGYGITKEALTAADVALGLRQQRQGAQQYEEPIRNVLEGATYEAGGQAAGPIIQNALSATGRGVTNVLGKLQDVRQLPKQLAADIARKTFETPANLAAGRNALRQAVETGQTVTPAQALAQSKVISPTTQAMLDDATTRIAPMAKETKAVEQAATRMSTIKEITPDINAAVIARRDASKPFYEAADKAIVPLDKDVSAVLARMPKGTLAAAANIAKMEGRPFVMGQKSAGKMMEMPGQFDKFGKPIMVPVESKLPELTGESMHYIRRALSDVAYGPTASTGAGRDTQMAARTLLDDYIKVFEAKVPEYAQARAVFSDLSAPVNQAQVLKEMVSILEKPGGGERIGPFLNVLGRGETAMLKRAGGRGAPRYTALEEVLTPEQVNVVRGVAKELETNAAVKQEISLGQQRFSDLMKEVLPSFSLPNVFNIFATTANKVLDVVGVKAGKKTMAQLEKAALNANSFDELLNTLPATERNRVFKIIRDPETWQGIVNKTSKAIPKQFRGPAITGATEALNVPQMPVNALAPQQEQNQNALVR